MGTLARRRSPAQPDTLANPPPLPSLTLPDRPRPPPRAGLAWEWMEEALGVNQGQQGNTMPKQYRQGQFKVDEER